MRLPGTFQEVMSLAHCHSQMQLTLDGTETDILQHPPPPHHHHRPHHGHHLVPPDLVHQSSAGL